MFQIKKQGKSPRKKDFNKTEISNLPYKEFKVMFFGKKKFTYLGRKMNEHSQNFNKET